MGGITLLVKLTASLLLLLSCGAVGYLISQRYSLRVKEISYLQLAINNLEAEILYYSTPLPLAMKRVGKRAHKKIEGFFIDTYKILDSKEGYRINEAWEIAVLKNISNTSLSKEEKELLIGFGRDIGLGNKDIQRRYFEFIKSLLEEQRIIALEEKAKNGRMFNRLGILLGLGLVIILI